MKNIYTTLLDSVKVESDCQKIDIFLITYNRAKNLDNTLVQILSEESPIRNYKITIIDNNSTDNTCEVVAKYQKDFSNLKYECNKYNIGGNANIVKAFYKATNEYVWVLADNDSFKWDSWKDVEVAIEKQSDAIIVANYNCPKWDIASLFLQTTFLPGVIYKRANIDDTVMCNMEFNISNMFPHLALSAKLFNENKNFTILDNPIINVEANEDENGEYTYTRGFEGYVHPLQRGMNWISGYANSLYLIKDKKIRNYIISHNYFITELNSAKLFFWKDKAAESNLYNYLCVFNVLSLFDKLRFLINVILYFTLFRIIFISRREIFICEENKHIIQYDLRLFYFIKTRLFKIIKDIERERK